MNSEYEELSAELCEKVAEIARRELSSLGDDYRLVVHDQAGQVLVLGERDRPPYKYVGIWIATVEGLVDARRTSRPLEDNVASVNITSDQAPAVMAALARMFGGEPT